MARELFGVARLSFFSGAIFLQSAGPIPAQQTADLKQRFTKIETMVAMRDGVRLNTDIYVPRAVKGPLPFVMMRTPYGSEHSATRFFVDYLKDLEKEGYIFVSQYIRGRYKSEGTFVMS